MTKFNEIKSPRFRCRICRKPFSSQKARKTHYSRAHTDDYRSRLAYNICMMHIEGDCSRKETAEWYGVDYQVVCRIVNNWMQWPNFYALDPKLEGETFDVIPISTKKRQA